MSLFSQSLLAWFDQSGRHDLPWQKDITPYRVWVSEIMLQQTQVKTVIPYYLAFMARFPTLQHLASVPQEAVLAHWSGLGYYARARNLHKAAQQIMDIHHGEFPRAFDDIVALPGIGRSTAGAILAIALQQRYAILDGNVKRVLSRYYAVSGWPGEKAIETDLWHKAWALTPQTRFADYTQAIMDLGATLCTRTRPNCTQCPVASTCQAWSTQSVAQFPQSKPKKTKPIKHTVMLILENPQGQVLLEQRPQQGIWGGLWSFPEYACLKTCRQALEDPLQTPTASLQSLIEWQAIRHTFSHYHLDIQPVYLRLIEQETAPYNGVWVNKHDVQSGFAGVANALGIPAPVTKLISFMDAMSAIKTHK
jgi:A/G-specific adenine glycosylase